MKQMAFTIKHEIRGRMRIHLSAGRMTIRQADLFSFYLSSLPQVKEAKVYERTGDAVIVYAGERSELIRQILQFRFDDEALKELVPKNSGRAINQEYEEKLVKKSPGKAVYKGLSSGANPCSPYVFFSHSFSVEGHENCRQRKAGGGSP